MRLSTEAAISIGDERHGDFVQAVTVHGSVWEPANDTELGVHIAKVEGLPHWLELGDLSDIQQEACALALQYEYERRQRLTQRLPQEVDRIAASLRLATEYVPTLRGELAAHERIGALTSAIERAQEQLRSLRKEAA